MRIFFLLLFFFSCSKAIQPESFKIFETRCKKESDCVAFRGPCGQFYAANVNSLPKKSFKMTLENKTFYTSNIICGTNFLVETPVPNNMNALCIKNQCEFEK